MSEAEAASQTAEGTGNGEVTTEVAKPTWIEQLPEDLRSDESFHGFRTIGELVIAHKNSLAEREGLVRVPGEDASDEDRAAYHKLIGVPETPDGYELAPPEGLREGLYNKDMEAAFRAKAHELGLPGTKAAELNNWYYQMMSNGDKQIAQNEQQALDAAMNTLKDEWKGDTFKANSTLAQRAFKTFAGEMEGAQEFLEKTKVGDVALGNHPMFLRIFAGIGQKISDDSSFGRETKTGELSDEDRARARFPKTQFKE